MGRETVLSNDAGCHTITRLVFGCSFLLLVGLGCALLAPPLVFLYIDFPCFVSVEQGYLVTGPYSMGAAGQDLPDAELWINVFPEYTGGGSCDRFSLQNGETTSFGKYQVGVNDDVVTVDGTTRIAVGQSWKDSTTRLGLNPWWLSEDSLEIRNEGFVTGERTRDGTIVHYPHKVLIVTGAQGSRGRIFNPVTLVVFIACAITFASLGIYRILAGKFPAWSRMRKAP